MKPFTIVFTGGGSGGHVSPNIALIDYIKKIRPEAEIHYIGADGIEKQLITPKIAIFHEIKAEKFSRGISHFFQNLKLPFALSKSISQAERLLAKIRPDVVFSKGGFVSLPVVIAAKRLKIRTITHESDSSLGLANKISKHYADLTLSSFDLKTKGIICVGSPISQKIYSVSPEYAWKATGLNRAKKVLLVTGGSLGSTELNKFIESNLAVLTRQYCIILISGKNKKIGAKNTESFFQTEYTDRITDLYSIADLCLTRGGSNTLFELVALGVPFICVPLSHSGRGEQQKNAVMLAQMGSGSVLTGKELSLQNVLQASHGLTKKPNFSVDGTKKICDYILGGTTIE